MTSFFDRPLFASPPHPQKRGDSSDGLKTWCYWPCFLSFLSAPVTLPLPPPSELRYHGGGACLCCAEVRVRPADSFPRELRAARRTKCVQSAATTRVQAALGGHCSASTCSSRWREASAHSTGSLESALRRTTRALVNHSRISGTFPVRFGRSMVF